MWWLALLGCTDNAAQAAEELLEATQPVITDLDCQVCDGECTEQLLEYSDRHHTAEPIDYAVTPPAGGPHNYCWGEWGAHTTPLPDDNWVHNLEHGGIVYLYSCPDGCGEEQAALSALTGLGKVIVTEYPELPTRFAAISWGHRLMVDCFDEEAFTAFYEDHVDQGPETTMAAPPSSCN